MLEKGIWGQTWTFFKSLSFIPIYGWRKFHAEILHSLCVTRDFPPDLYREEKIVQSANHMKSRTIQLTTTNDCFHVTFAPLQLSRKCSIFSAFSQKVTQSLCFRKVLFIRIFGDFIWKISIFHFYSHLYHKLTFIWNSRAQDAFKMRPTRYFHICLLRLYSDLS